MSRAGTDGGRRPAAEGEPVLVHSGLLAGVFHCFERVIEIGGGSSYG